MVETSEIRPQDSDGLYITTVAVDTADTGSTGIVSGDFVVDAYQEVSDSGEVSADVSVGHPLFRRTTQTSSEVLVAAPAVEFDVTVAGIKYGLIDVVGDGSTSRTLLPPNNPMLWPDNVRKLDVSGMWSPESLTVYSEDEIPVGFTTSGEPIFDLSSQYPTPLRQLLWTLCYLEFVPILNRYKNDPEKLRYAGNIFNHIVEGLERASRLGTTVTAFLRPPDDFLIAVENYYNHPSEEDETRIPISRVRVERVMPGRMDDRHVFADTSVVDSLVQDTHRLRAKLAVLDRENRQNKIDTSARNWSDYFYGEGILMGPVPGDLLPEELLAEVDPFFGRWDSQNFLNTLVPFDKTGVVTPNGAENIIRDFEEGLRRILGFFETAAIPLEYQAMAAGADFMDPTVMPQVEIIGDQRLINNLPTAETATRFAVDSLHDLTAYSDGAAVFESDDVFLNGEALVSLRDDLLEGWTDLQAEFENEQGDEAIPQEVVELYGERYYIYFTRLFFDVVMERLPQTVLWDEVHQIMCAIESVDDEAKFSSQAGKTATGQWIKFYSRKALIAVMTMQSKILKEHRERVFQAADDAYHDTPERKSFVQDFKKKYTDSLWFFDTWAMIYASYQGSTRQQSTNMDVATLVRQTPFIQTIQSEGEETLRVLDRGREIASQQLDDPVLYLRGWDEYSSLREEITQASGTEMGQTIARFLENEATDRDLFAALTPLGDEENSEKGKALKAVLFSRYEKLEKSAWATMPPLDARAFINRLRSVVNVVVYFEQVRTKASERVSLDLAAVVYSEFMDWAQRAPYGWPQRDGTTPEGFVLDAHFIPRQDFYLSSDQIVSYFLPDYSFGAEEAVRYLTRFFADRDGGYERYFLTGGFIYNSEGQPVGFSQSPVFLNQLLLVLDDWAKIAEIQLEKGALKTEEERVYAQRVLTISRQLMFNIQQEILTSGEVPYYATTERDGIFSGIVPLTLDHTLDPVVDYGSFDEELSFKTYNIIDRGRYSSWTVIKDATESFSVRTILPEADKLDATGYGRFEDFLSACPKPEAMNESWWMVRTAGLSEMQYVVGRLTEIADSAEGTDPDERRQELVTAALRTPLTLLRRLPDRLENGTYTDPEFLAAYPSCLRDRLPSLTPAETMWLAGELRLRLAASDAYDRDRDIIRFSYEDERLADLESHLSTLSPVDAKRLLAGIAGEYGDDFSELRNYYSNPEHAQAWQRRKRVFMLCNGDDIHQQKGREDVLTNAELLYLTLLLAQDVSGIENTGIRNRLAAEATTDSSGTFLLSKVLAVYEQIPASDKREAYTFVYYRSVGYYQDGVAQALERRTSIFHAAATSEDCALWGFFKEVPRLVPSTGETRSFIFSDDQRHMIVASWEYNGIQPAVPQKAQTDTQEFSAFLDSVLDDPDFFERNKTVLVNHVLSSAGIRPSDQAALWQRYARRGSFTGEEVRNFNSQILGAIHPLLSDSSRSRMDTVQSVDRSLQKALSAWTDMENVEDLVLDPQTQIVVAETLDELEGLYREASRRNPQYTHVADAYADLKDILLGQYDEASPVARSLYSRYNPNGRKGVVGLPADLAILYSRYFFITLTGTENPHLAYSVESMLQDVYHILESGADGESIRAIISGWNDLEALQCLSLAFRQYYAAYTTAFYVRYDFDRVSLVREQIAQIQSDMDSRIAALVQETDSSQSVEMTSGVLDERGSGTINPPSSVKDGLRRDREAHYE